MQGQMLDHGIRLTAGGTYQAAAQLNLRHFGSSPYALLLHLRSTLSTLRRARQLVISILTNHEL